jgi:hypothetical protein
MDSVICQSCRNRVPIAELTSSACPHCGKDVRGKRTRAAESTQPPISHSFADSSSSAEATDEQYMQQSPFAYVPSAEIFEEPQSLVEAPSPPLPIISRYDESYNESIMETAKPSAASSWFIHIGPRTLRYSVYFGGWLGPPLLLLLPILWGDWGFCCPFICLGLPWYTLGHWPMRWLTPLVVSMFITKLRCPGCHEVYSPVNQWNCSCGYHDFRIRNVFLFRCPKCRNRIGWMQCERCETTIMF